MKTRVFDWGHGVKVVATTAPGGDPPPGYARGPVSTLYSVTYNGVEIDHSACAAMAGRVAREAAETARELHYAQAVIRATDPRRQAPQGPPTPPETRPSFGAPIAPQPPPLPPRNNGAELFA